MPGQESAIPSPDSRQVDPQSPKRSSRWLSGLLAAGLFLLAGAFLLLARPAASEGPARIDENEWLAMGVVTYGLATTGSVPDRGASEAELGQAAEAPWRMGISESTFGWMNPVVPKLLFGRIAKSSGVEQTSRAIYPRFREAGAGLRQRDAARKALKPALEPARRAVAGLAAALAVALFFAVRAGLGTAAGALAFALLLASPAFRESATYVRTGLFPLGFGLAALVLVQQTGGLLFGRGRPLLAAASAVFLGVLAGLAVGSKLNGALVSFAIAGWFVVLPFLRPPETRAGLIGLAARLALVGGLCAALFWLSLPSLWGELPWQAVPDLLDRWQASLVHQVRAGGGAAPEGLLDRAALCARRAFFEGEPLHQLTGLPLGLGLAAVGALALTRELLRSHSPRRSAVVALAIFGLVIAVGTTLWLPLDRERFFLPLLIPVVCLEGAAAGFAARLLPPKLGG